MQRRKYRCGSRVKSGPVVLRCSSGHVVRLPAYTTVPPCGAGPRGNKCCSVDYVAVEQN